MDFLFEVKLKNGQVTKITIKLSTASLETATQKLIQQVGEMTSYKLVSKSPNT